MNALTSDQTRFLTKVIQSGSCWRWTGAKSVGPSESKTRPMFKFRGTANNAARVSYVLFHETDPGSLLVCHECDNPMCVNPTHLFLGTHQDNVDDMVRKGRRQWKRATHCKHGHEFSEQNTLHVKKDGRTYQQCATCKGNWIAKARAKNTGRIGVELWSRQ